MRPRGSLWAGVVGAAVSLAGFGLVVWKVDRPPATGFPAPLGPREREEVESALQTYREIYQDLFASGGAPDLLNEFPATASVKHGIYREIGYLRDAGLVQVHDLASAATLEANATAPDVASAVVLEEWNTETQRAADRSPVAVPRGSSQAYRYVLARVRGAWVVAAWDLADAPPRGPGGGSAR